MPIIRNYHMHTELCGHAVGTIEDNINMAKQLNYKTIGFSEHAPLPLDAFNEVDNKRLYAYENMTIDILKTKYLDVLKKYQNNSDIEIYIGLESEYLPTYHKWYVELYNKVEYLILGVHFFEHNGKLYDTYAEINNETMYYYADAVVKALDSGMFKILAHPDLYLYDNIEFNDDAKKVADIIIDAAIRNNVLVEINCNGKGKYPRSDFYEYIKNKNCTYIIGVDSHDPKRLCGQHIEDSLELAKRLNLRVIDKIEVKR